MPLNMDALRAFAENTEKKSGGTYAGKLGMGKTSVIVFIDPRLDPTDASLMIKTGSGLFAHAKDSFTDKITGETRLSDKYVMLFLVNRADDPQSLPKGWDGNWAEVMGGTRERAEAIGAERMIVPLAVPSTLKSAIIAAFESNASPADINPVTGEILRPTDGGAYTLLLSRTGEGKKTEYTAQLYTKCTPAETALYKSIKIGLLPDTTILDIAADFAAFRAESSKGASIAAKTPTASPATGALSSIADTDFGNLSDLL